MASETFYIKLGPHFKLWVALKDTIALDTALCTEKIPFHIDENQSTIGSAVRYFFPDSHREHVDNVVKNTGIIASTETIPSTDYEISCKLNRLYLMAVAIIVLLLVIGTTLFG